MALYRKSDGTILDTNEMDMVYIQRALNKAEAEGNEENILALESELTLRTGN